MTLHLVQLEPRAPQLARLALDAGLPHADPGYLWHFALRQAFGASAPQPFRILEPEPDGPLQRRRLRILGYAKVDAAGLRDVARQASDAARAVFPPERIEHKAMPDRFARGRRLAFSVRACAIVRTRSRDGSRRRELDVFVHQASIDPHGPKPDRGEVYGNWLAERLDAGGAQLVEARLAGFRLGPLVRRSHASTSGRTATMDGAPRRLLALGSRGAARRPDATLDGTLEVTDPDRFAALLARGVGRHRAFGFGMLLLRPAG
jgi:CRISPR system Cascade subunit CasE